MNERRTVEEMTKRLYRHHLKSTGNLPEGAEQRVMEAKVRKAAVTVEKKKRRNE